MTTNMVQTQPQKTTHIHIPDAFGNGCLQYLYFCKLNRTSLILTHYLPGYLLARGAVCQVSSQLLVVALEMFTPAVRTHYVFLPGDFLGVKSDSLCCWLWLWRWQPTSPHLHLEINLTPVIPIQCFCHWTC